MTAEELRSYFNRIFGLNPRPLTFEVDSETYANCCQFIFNQQPSLPYDANIKLGPNKGLMFKGVELILKESK